MKRIEIQVEETVTYEEDITVIQPDDMTDEDFEVVLQNAIKKNDMFEGGAKELASILEQNGLAIDEQTHSFPDSPRNTEVEVLNTRDVTGKGE